jgi:hypothetical protein
MYGNIFKNVRLVLSERETKEWKQAILLTYLAFTTQEHAAAERECYYATE